MRSVVHNFILEKNCINSGSESMALRCAYLLSGEVLSTGCSYGTVCYDEYMRSGDIEMKVRALEIYEPQIFSENWDSADNVISMLKVIKKTKHPQPQQIILHKKLEKAIAQLWEHTHIENLNKMMKSGLPQLAPLVNDDDFVVLPVHTKETEQDDKYFFPMSKIFNLDFEEDENIDLFFLPFEFTLNLFMEKMPAELKPRFMETVLVLPNLNALTTDELKAVKAALQSETAPLHLKMDEWIQACATRSEKETRAVFENEIKPLTTAIQQKLDENPVIKHIDSLYGGDKPRVEVVMGEAPLQLVWEFYNTQGTIPEQTWKILEAMNSNGSITATRIAFMANKAATGWDKTLESPAKTVEAEVVAPVRKTLDID